jgi:hypothetical protein
VSLFFRRFPVKNVTVIVSGAPEGRNLHEASVSPGTTPRDLKARLRIPADYLISVEGSGQFLANDENLFAQLADGQELRATAPAVAAAACQARQIVRSQKTQACVITLPNGKERPTCK